MIGGHIVGVMRDGAGLKPSAEGARVAFDGAQRTLKLGPFGIVGELASGYWIWTVKDLDEAIGWVRQCPNPMPGPKKEEGFQTAVPYISVFAVVEIPFIHS